MTAAGVCARLWLCVCVYVCVYVCVCVCVCVEEGKDQAVDDLCALI